MAKDDEELYIKDLRESSRGARRRFPKLVTTMAVGEEGDQPTTMAVGEEGDGRPVPALMHGTIVTTLTDCGPG